MATGEPKTLFDTYRDEIDRPLFRIFTRFGRARWPIFLLGLVFNVVQRTASLVPPFILGIAIDATFNGSQPYVLPFVPSAWIPTERSAQVLFTFGVLTASFVVLAVAALVRGLCMDYYSHRLMHDVRTATYEKLQRLDMAVFESEDTGEIMSVLNNDVSNFEQFFDDAIERSAER